MEVFHQTFFKDYYRLGKVNYENLAHLLIRSVNFFMLTWLTIIAAHYAIAAGVNFGIIASIICVSTPINCLLSYLFWGEKLSKKIMFGTFLVIAGVVWVSLARGEKVAIDDSQDSKMLADEGERDWARSISIVCALFVGSINALRT
jgi:drug/metabolite transporter (DMT)-like permease